MRKRARFSSLLPAIVVLLQLSAFAALAADWPAFRHDAERSGVTAEELQPRLHPQWYYVHRHAPKPAWPEPGRELNRIEFDYVYNVAVADGVVYFGSSADHKVYAMDLATGRERWRFFTEGPVRFAPAIEDGRVFVASDDGWLYGLSATEGKLLWKFRGAPTPEKLIGNEQMISRWPLRSGVVVEDGIVYFSAGMWPAEGVYMYALRAEDGKVIWKNDTSGTMYINQPHPGSSAMTGVAPQGYMVAHEGWLFVPTGRNVPAAYDRETGKLLYYHGAPDGWGNRWGGAWNFAWGGLLFGWSNHVGPDINVRLGESDPWEKDGLVAFQGETGKRIRELEGKLRAVISDDILYASGSGRVSAYDLDAIIEGKKPEECVNWETPHGRAYALIMAGDTLIVGGKDAVTAISAGDGKVLWNSNVTGQARGLAVADGRLLVSTTEGQITCFGPEFIAETPAVFPKDDASPYADDEFSAKAAAMARRIIDETRIAAGYCLMLGADDVRLACELAKRSDLTICCLEPDAAKVDAARRALDAAGLYGVRVAVHEGSATELPYGDYFADLIVFSGGAPGDLNDYSARELYRVLRPCGGTVYMASATGLSTMAMSKLLLDGGAPSDEMTISADSIRMVRGELPGAGEWTHQYADAGRSGASKDQLVKLPLKLLWFGEPGPARMIARHWAGPAPLSISGRMFVVGQYSIIAVDAYNGRELWRRDIPGAGRFPARSTGSNVAVDEDSVYVATRKTCLRLSAESGETTQTYQAPLPEGMSEEAAKSLVWGYLTVGDDLILGSIGSAHESRWVFVVGKDDGKPRWTYAAEERVSHNALSMAGGCVYLLDRTRASEIKKANKRGEKIAINCKLLAFEAATGKVIWQTEQDVVSRTALWLSEGVLVATGGNGMTTWSASDGTKLWARKAKMARFPVIVGDTIYGEPYAYDLRTGETKQRVHPLTGEKATWRFARAYGCGSIAGNPNMLLFRSGTLGFWDLAGDSGTANFGGVRAGCHVNAITANGLVLVPTADATCTCSYNYQTTVALMPAEREEQWYVFAAGGVRAGTRMRQVALNIGAPGDRRDSEGKMWLGFPRPRAGAALKVAMKTDIAPQAGYYHRSPNEPAVQGADSPWLYASGCEGLRSAVLDLIIARPKEMPKVEPTSYTVRLHFAELEDLKPGQRVFDVKLQGETALAGLDVVKEAGGPNIALVREFKGVKAADTLKLELVAKSRGPIISGIELQAE